MLLTALMLCIGVTSVHGVAKIACPDGWFLYDNYCFLLARGQLTNLEAFAECKGHDASLSYPYEEKEITALKSWLAGMDTAGAAGAWLNHKYSSYDGWGYDDDDYTDWADDAAPGGEGFCKFMSASKDWQWDAVDCETKQDMLYICEMDASIKDCDGNTCYTLSPSTSTNTCSEGDRITARIESEAENNFVKQFLREAKPEAEKFTHSMFRYGGQVYIDGNDEDTEGTWVFSDGTAMPFTDFDAGEPNNAGAGENCIVMATGRDYKWIDYECDNIFNMYLCEKVEEGTVG